MTRNKVKLTYILNNTARKTTFKRRKVGVVKKLDELTTLCGIEACTVIYSEFDSEPFVWPSVDEVRRLIMKYKRFSKVDQGRRKVNQETFTRQRLEKIQEKLRKQLRENRRNEMTHYMFQSMIDPQTMSRFNIKEFEELARVTGQNLMEVDRMMDIRQRESSSFNPPPPPPQFGTGQQLVLRQDEFMPPTHGGFGSYLAPNMTYPFPPPNMGFEPNNMNFQPGNMMFQPLNIDFQHANMGFQPPNMGLEPLPSDFPQNDMNPNMGMPYPSNPSPFPYYPNNDMGPHEPSSH